MNVWGKFFKISTSPNLFPKMMTKELVAIRTVSDTIKKNDKTYLCVWSGIMQHFHCILSEWESTHKDNAI